MTRRAIRWLALVVGLMVVTAMPAPGQARLRWRATRAAGWHSTPRRTQPAWPRTTREQAVRAAQSDYPKYTGAFHARYFDGVPSIYGTRPIRGTAW